MPKRKTNKVTNEELLGFLTNAFTSTQDQINGVQGQLSGLVQLFTEFRAEVNGRLDDHDKEFEYASAERAALSRKLDQTIKVTDTHDQILTKIKR